MKTKLVFTIVDGILKAEKEIFFLTGYAGGFLRGYWEHRGRIIQKELNDQHGTKYSYGYIID